MDVVARWEMVLRQTYTLIFVSQTWTWLNALEDSQVAYRLAKGTVLPADRDRFTKMHEEATLCSSSFIRQAYKVSFSYLVVLDPNFSMWFG